MISLLFSLFLCESNGPIPLDDSHFSPVFTRSPPITDPISLQREIARNSHSIGEIDIPDACHAAPLALFPDFNDAVSESP